MPGLVFKPISLWGADHQRVTREKEEEARLRPCLSFEKFAPLVFFQISRRTKQISSSRSVSGQEVERKHAEVQRDLEKVKEDQRRTAVCRPTAIWEILSFWSKQQHENDCPIQASEWQRCRRESKTRGRISWMILDWLLPPAIWTRQWQRFIAPFPLPFDILRLNKGSALAPSKRLSFTHFHALVRRKRFQDSKGSTFEN